MGWAYPIEITGTDGKPREVIIPYLPNLHGRQIWALMKDALRQISEQMDDQTRQAINHTDDLITPYRPEKLDNADGRPIPWSVEQALGCIAAQIEDKMKMNVIELFWAASKRGQRMDVIERWLATHP
jgi:hypothetical protein